MKTRKKEQNQLIDTEKQPTIVVADAVADGGPPSATSFDAILERMKVATNTKSDTAFAKSLGLYQSSVSSAKERQSIPPAWAVQIAEMHGVSIDWLMFGDGSQTRKKNEEIVRETVEKLQGWSPPAASQAEAEPATATIYNDCEKPESNIADLVSKTIEVLQSRTVFQTALESNIEAFHHAIVLDKKIDQVEERIMRNVSARLDALEAENKQTHAENQQLRQELEQSRAQSTLSDTG